MKMNEFLLPKLEGHLASLAKWRTFKRNDLVAKIREEVQKTDESMQLLAEKSNNLQHELEVILQQHQGLTIKNKELNNACRVLRDKAQQLHDVATQWKSASQMLKKKYDGLLKIHTTTTDQLVQYQVDLKELNDRHSHLHTEMDDLSSKFGSLKSSWEELTNKYRVMESELESRKEELKELEENSVNLSAKLNKSEWRCQELEKTRTELEKNLSSLSDQLDHSESSRQSLQRKHDLIQQRYDLICSILNNQPEQDALLSQFKKWLKRDFSEGVQRLELPARDTTEILNQSHAILHHVELLVDAPALRAKTLVAVAGGFSSGKSSFISSFMKGKEASNLLAVGIQPVTAIPTYVMHNENLDIKGYTFRGASVPLSVESYGMLTHEFIKNMGFNMKDIMPHVVVEAPIYANDRPIANLAFIDTPGYNPAASAHMDTASDHDIAGTAIMEASAVLWLIGMDTNGTIPEDDLNFLLDNAVGLGKPVYVVVNKADLRPLDQVELVIDEVNDRLMEYGIEVEGVCAYSSTLGNELYSTGMSIFEALEVWNQPVAVGAKIVQDFSAMMDDLAKASLVSLRNIASILTAMKSVRASFHEVASNFQGAEIDDSDKNSKRYRNRRLPDVRNEFDENLSNLFDALQLLTPEKPEEILAELRQHGSELISGCLSYIGESISDSCHENYSDSMRGEKDDLSLGSNARWVKMGD
ncbi:hypothetical protein EBQ25_08775 [Allofranklinella schreckenbergeri]|uniref:Dynamin N-terminal domain-containing protein n=1 Tax=Allofranklinella schreckenbergeri TaxID=1076744 RepID=A0A3M6Q624_9BURK|nr:dynamin family protein [Allofranklinella schreckenbergeri]RMW98652.1 hypothetical protein EBQ25_08775 [Allofranklinella schreckenbergeri]